MRKGEWNFQKSFMKCLCLLMILLIGFRKLNNKLSLMNSEFKAAHKQAWKNKNIFKTTKTFNICTGNSTLLVPQSACSNPCALPLRTQSQGRDVWVLESLAFKLIACATGLDFS